MHAFPTFETAITRFREWLRVPAPRLYLRWILLFVTAVAVLDNVLPQDPTEPRPISSRLPGPWIGEAGMLREGGTLYLIWCVIAVVYVGAMWKWPPLVRPYAPLKVVGRLLGSVGLLVVVSVMLFLMLLPTGS